MLHLRRQGVVTPRLWRTPLASPQASETPREMPCGIGTRIWRIVDGNRTSYLVSGGPREPIAPTNDYVTCYHQSIVCS